MDTRNKKLELRSETITISNKVTEALLPIMEKAKKMGFSYEAFHFIVFNELQSMIDYSVKEDVRKLNEKENKKGN